MSDKFLNTTGLEHFWGKVKSNLDLLVNTSDIITNEEIDGMFVTKVIAPVVECYSDGSTYSLRITNIQEGYEYYYTLNTDQDMSYLPDAPSDPTKESTLYTEPIDITFSYADFHGYYGYYIKVIAYVGGESSDIVELIDFMNISGGGVGG